MFFWILLIFIIYFVIGQREEPFKIEIVSDEGGENELSWRLERVNADYSVDLIDEGTGINNKLVTKPELFVNSTDCLRINLTDSHGDGICCYRGPDYNGYIDVYFGYESIDLYKPTEQFDGVAVSDKSLELGERGDPGSVIYYIQNGVIPFGGCKYPNIIKPNTLCHEDINVDIIFVLDTSSDLLGDCQYYYGKTIIDLIESYIPRGYLKISIITYGTDNRSDTIINTPLSSTNRGNRYNTGNPAVADDLISISFGNNWDDIKDKIQNLAQNDWCIGGGHSTVNAIDFAIEIYTATYGQTYDASRQQHMMLLTNDLIDTDQIKDEFPCEYYQEVLEQNTINFILVSEVQQVPPNQDLLCLIGDNIENSITIDYFSKLSTKYGNIQQQVCSADINVAMSEIFIDDTNNRYYVEIVNLGIPFNISSLVFDGDLFAGNIDDDTLINQGDVFIVGNMGNAAPQTPCDIYFAPSMIVTGSADCNNYFGVAYDGVATLSSFTLSINNSDNSIISISPSDNFSIEPGYSYELQLIDSDDTNLSNWRESCFRYGSPGKLNVAHCPIICDPAKCINNNDINNDGAAPDSASQCNPTTLCQTITASIGDYTFCELSECQCSLNYYSDINRTRSCIPVQPPTSCSVDFSQTNFRNRWMLEITWSASPYIAVTSYKIDYGPGITLSGNTLSVGTGNTLLVTADIDLNKEYSISMTTVGIDLTDRSTVESLPRQCTSNIW